MDAGDGGEDGEDEDGRGGGRRKRTQNVMGNIRNYDIDQLDAQPKTDVIPVSRSLYFLFSFTGQLSFRTDELKEERRSRQTRKFPQEHVTAAAALVVSRLVFKWNPTDWDDLRELLIHVISDHSRRHPVFCKYIGCGPRTNKKERNKVEIKRCCQQCWPGDSLGDMRVDFVQQFTGDPCVSKLRKTNTNTNQR